jgi:hypothetical protein
MWDRPEELKLVRMRTDQITWTQDHIADVPLQRFTAHAGEVEVGYVEYDGGNRMWVWSSRLADDAWGWGSTDQAAKNGLEAWLRGWLENFRPLLN